MIRGARRLAFASAVALGACSDASSGDTDGGSDTETETTQPSVTTDDAVGSSGLEPVCIPRTQRCADPGTVETCSEAGTAWIPEPCADNSSCVACGDPGCTTARCESPCEVAPDLPSTAGCAFTANQNPRAYENWPDGIVIGNPNDEGIATVQIYYVPEMTRDEMPYAAMPEFLLGPGEVSEGIPLDSAFVPTSASSLRQGGIFRIYSDLPVIAYQHAPLEANLGNESSLLLPDSVLGRDYVVVSAPASVLSGSYRKPSYVTVVALDDYTQLSWTPRTSALSGNSFPVPPANVGETAMITLSKYDTLQLVPSENDVDKDANPFGYATGWNLELDVSGTVIRSNKPVWVISGSRGSMIPIGNFGTGDPLQEVVFPLQTWGRKYVAPAPPVRDPSAPVPEKGYWRIFAGTDAVTIDSEPPHPDLPVTLGERGEFVDIALDAQVHTVLSGDGPFLPVQYLRSKSIPTDIAMVEDVPADITKGDSAMVQMVPTEQYLTRYTFATGVGFAFNFVQVIRRQGGAAVQLDGANVTGWEAASSDFEVATAMIAEGAHDIGSDEPFGIIQLGWTNSDLGNDPGCVRNEEFTDDNGVLFEAKECNASYAYPGGMKTEAIFVP